MEGLVGVAAKKAIALTEPTKPKAIFVDIFMCLFFNYFYCHMEPHDVK
jgi:uncharacterized membrane protein